MTLYVDIVREELAEIAEQLIAARAPSQPVAQPFGVYVCRSDGTGAQRVVSGGSNENPHWAPDGRHLVFSSTRSGRSQIYSMLADGTEVKQLSTQGGNWMPVWAK